MTNLILAIIIIVASFAGSSAKASKGMTLAMLAVIGVIMLFVSSSAAAGGDFGPAIGIGAFVGTIGIFWLLKRKRN